MTCGAGATERPGRGAGPFATSGNSGMVSDEVAHLLGYDELNSFLRAFASWTGTSVTDYRASNAAESV